MSINFLEVVLCDPTAQAWKLFVSTRSASLVYRTYVDSSVSSAVMTRVYGVEPSESLASLHVEGDVDGTFVNFVL